MNSLDKIINKKLKISLESLTVKDLLQIENLKEEEKVLSEYLDMSINHYLSLLKLKRLYYNKKIDDNTFSFLKDILKDYYATKKKIAEVEYIRHISDNINVENILNKYDDSLRYNYKYLSQYNILFDPIKDNMSEIIRQGIDFNINHKQTNKRTPKKRSLKNK
ncbi:MAG: hypothetical protein VZS44_07095 [Bacilli bacterium]|nr:hypothetical protein [Bacilli bacterium]